MKKALLSLGIVAAAAVTFSAIASSGTIQKSLLYEDIKITLDGREIKPCDVNGNYIEPFIIEGTTYLPVRGVASSLGLTVGWDGDTSTVILDDVKPDIKSVLYDKDGIKISYKGMEEEALCLFIENDFTDSMTLKSADFEYVVPSGKKANILLPADIKDGKATASFYILNTETQLEICRETEFTADSEKAELKIEEKPPLFEPEGEVTWDTFGEFFKKHKDYDNSGAGYCIKADFPGSGICEVGSLIMSYTPNMTKLTIDLVAICNVLDPVLNTEVLSPVSMSISIQKDKEKYNMSMIVPMNDEVSLVASGSINPTDGSVNIDTVRYNNYFNYIDQEYTTMPILNASERMVKDISSELTDLIIANGNEALSKKSNGLKLEFFGLKSSKGE